MKKILFALFSALTAVMLFGGAVFAAEESSFMFEPMNFIYNLKYMGTGMLCILIVIGVLIVITMLLNKVTSRKK